MPRQCEKASWQGEKKRRKKRKKRPALPSLVPPRARVERFVPASHSPRVRVWSASCLPRIGGLQPSLSTFSTPAEMASASADTIVPMGGGGLSRSLVTPPLATSSGTPPLATSRVTPPVEASGVLCTGGAFSCYTPQAGAASLGGEPEIDLSESAKPDPKSEAVAPSSLRVLLNVACSSLGFYTPYHVNNFGSEHQCEDRAPDKNDRDKLTSRALDLVRTSGKDLEKDKRLLMLIKCALILKNPKKQLVRPLMLADLRGPAGESLLHWALLLDKDELALWLFDLEPMLFACVYDRGEYKNESVLHILCAKKKLPLLRKLAKRVLFYGMSAPAADEEKERDLYLGSSIATLTDIEARLFEAKSAGDELREVNAAATAELRHWSWEQQWARVNDLSLRLEAPPPSSSPDWAGMSRWRSGWLQETWTRLVNGRADGSFFEPEKLGGQCYYGGTPVAISTVMGDVFTCRFLVMEVGCLSLRAWNQVEELLEKHPPEDGQGGAHLYPDSLAMPQEGDKYSGRYCSKELQVWDRSVCARLDLCDRFGNSPGHLAVQAHSDASMFAFLDSLYKDGYGHDPDAASTTGSASSPAAAAASTAGSASTPAAAAASTAGSVSTPAAAAVVSAGSATASTAGYAAASAAGSAAASAAGSAAASTAGSAAASTLGSEPKRDHPACRIVLQRKKEALEKPDAIRLIATKLVKGVLEKASLLRSSRSVCASSLGAASTLEPSSATATITGTATAASTLVGASNAVSTAPSPFMKFVIACMIPPAGHGLPVSGDKVEVFSLALRDLREDGRLLHEICRAPANDLQLEDFYTAVGAEFHAQAAPGCTGRKFSFGRPVAIATASLHLEGWPAFCSMYPRRSILSDPAFFLDLEQQQKPFCAAFFDVQQQQQQQQHPTHLQKLSPLLDELEKEIPALASALDQAPMRSLLSMHNKKGLTPLTLAVRLGKRRMFEGLWFMSANFQWSWGGASCHLLPLDQVDDIGQVIDANLPREAGKEAAFKKERQQCSWLNFLRFLLATFFWWFPLPWRRLCPVAPQNAAEDRPVPPTALGVMLRHSVSSLLDMGTESRPVEEGLRISGAAGLALHKLHSFSDTQPKALARTYDELVTTADRALRVAGKMEAGQAMPLLKYLVRSASPPPPAPAPSLQLLLTANPTPPPPPPSLCVCVPWPCR